MFLFRVQSNIQKPNHSGIECLCRYRWMHISKLDWVIGLREDKFSQSWVMFLFLHRITKQQFRNKHKEWLELNQEQALYSTQYPSLLIGIQNLEKYFLSQDSTWLLLKTQIIVKCINLTSRASFWLSHVLLQGLAYELQN